MIRVVVSSFTNPAHGQRVHQSFVGSTPICREQDDVAVCEKIAAFAIENHHGRYELWRYDGDINEETLVRSGDGGSGSEKR